MPGTQDLARAVEDNTRAFLLALGRAGGGEERTTPGIQWTVGGSPIAYHNAVVRADLLDASVDGVIGEFTMRLRELGVPGSWHVGETWRPIDLVDRLQTHGYELSEEPGMALELVTFEGSPVDRLQVVRISTVDDLEYFRQVLASGFGEGEPEANWVCSMYARIGLDDGSAWRHYLGLVDGRPVATASTYREGDVAGLYFVCTAPSDRRQGFGAAMTAHAVIAARAEGARVAVLTASPMGEGVYRRLGFQRCCTISVLEYDPRA